MIKIVRDKSMEIDIKKNGKYCETTIFKVKNRSIAKFQYYLMLYFLFMYIFLISFPFVVGTMYIISQHLN